MDYEALGKRIRTHRKLKNMTQEELAQAAGVSCSFIGHIERGSRKLSVDTLVKIAEILQISCDSLLQDSFENPPPSPRAETRRMLLRELISMLGEEEN